ncbi:APC family permease [Streptomyces sp. NPDC051018]|uniref:APC family permease n=1 Tax=Streptomyces sp. NPDC051018 TaxID=3365639 RepID=UPI0037ACBB18
MTSERTAARRDRASSDRAPSDHASSRWATAPGIRGTHQGFVRRSTGVVRQISGADAVIGNILLVNFVAAVATLVVVPFTFPGANLPLAVLLALLPALALATVYVLFALALPRSGGEYLYVSRVFHPSVGFAANFSFIGWNILFGGLLVNQFATVYLSGFFASLGWSAGVSAMSHKGVVLLVGVVLIALTTIPVIVGTRFAMRVMKGSFYVGSVLLLITLAVLAFAGHDTFVASVDQQASYTGIIESARQAGFESRPEGFAPTVQAVALISLATMFVMCSTYTTGEVQDVRRSVPKAVYGSALIGVAVIVVMALIATRVWSTDFLAAANYLSSVAPERYPLESTPDFSYLAVLTRPGWLFSTVVNVSFLCLITGNLIFGTATMSRCFSAWSFDRIMPQALASVSTRRRTPVNALLVFAICSVLALVYYTFDGDVTFLAGATLGFIATFLTVSAAAIAFPYLRPRLFRGSAADIRVVGVPVIVIAGVASSLMLGAMVYAFLTNDAFDANGTTGLLFFAGFWVVGLVVFGVARRIHLRRGLPFDAAFKELTGE